MNRLRELGIIDNPELFSGISLRFTVYSGTGTFKIEAIKLPSNTFDQDIVTKKINGSEVFYGTVKVNGVKLKLIDRDVGTVAIIWDNSLSCESRDVNR